MDALESPMNIKNIFKRFTNDAEIVLESGVIDIQSFRDGKLVSIEIEFFTQERLKYEIFLHKNTSKVEVFHFSKKGVGHEIYIDELFDEVKRDHPDFFEWILWNIM